MMGSDFRVPCPLTEFRTEIGVHSWFAYRWVPARTSGECWESYFCFRCRADGLGGITDAGCRRFFACATLAAWTSPNDHPWVAGGLAAVLCLSFV